MEVAGRDELTATTAVLITTLSDTAATPILVLCLLAKLYLALVELLTRLHSKDRLLASSTNIRLGGSC